MSITPDSEQDAGQAARVSMPFVQLGGGVAVTEQKQIHFLARFAVLHDGPDLTRGGRAAVHDIRCRVDHDGPHLAERVLPVALFDHNLHGARRGGEAQRLAERPPLLLRLRRGLPFSVDAGETARVEQVVGLAVDDFEKVLPEVRVIDQAVEPPGPLSLQ
jgi:hypothetical protein